MVKILWVDDEVELLKPHVLFLKQKGYEVDTCNNGYDAIDMAAEGAYDLIILDEMMPGMTGERTVWIDSNAFQPCNPFFSANCFELLAPNLPLLLQICNRFIYRCNIRLYFLIGAG